jgi:hypothetical protein
MRELFFLLIKHHLRTRVFFHLIFWTATIHLLGQLGLALFRAEIFGDLSLSSVVPVPGRGMFNLWLLVCSGLFSAGALGATFLPYFHSEGRELFFLQRKSIWWAYPLLSLLILLFWFSLLVIVTVLFSRFVGQFYLRPEVSLFRIGLIFVIAFLSMVYTVGTLSLFVSPGVAVVVIFSLTIGIEVMCLLERFGLWTQRGLLSTLPHLFPSGDLGFEAWKWLHGAPVHKTTLFAWLGSFFLAFGLYAVLLRLLFRFRSSRL